MVGTRRIDVTREGAAIARNEATAMIRVLPARTAPDRDHPDWQRVLDQLHAWRAERLDEHALAVVVHAPAPSGGSGLTFAVTSTRSDEPAALVVGRHTQCDVELDDAACLRHAVVLLWPDAKVGARAIAMDLATPLGLRSRRGPARRIASATALQFGAGACEVFVLVAARDQPFAVRWRDELDAHVSGALVDDDLPRPQLPPDHWERSVVSRVGRNRERTDTLVVAAPPRSLAEGVLLGRYERCRRTAAINDSAEVSRVHALVFAADGALWIVDTASTHGTRLATGAQMVELDEGRRIARVGDDTRVLLADVEVGLDFSGR